MRVNAIILYAFVTLLSSCESKLRKDFKENTQKTNDELSVPEPKFDKELGELLVEYKEKYDAKSVRIGRPFIYTSKDDYNYWLKVEFLNPEFDNKTFKEFGKEVALNTLAHLTNDQDFEKIEVSVTQKKGFILTFSTSQNTFFYRDSLQVTQK